MAIQMKATDYPKITIYVMASINYTCGCTACSIRNILLMSPFLVWV